MIPSIDAQPMISYRLISYKKPLQAIVFQFQVIYNNESVKVAINQLRNDLQALQIHCVHM